MPIANVERYVLVSSLQSSFAFRRRSVFQKLAHNLHNERVTSSRSQVSLCRLSLTSKKDLSSSRAPKCKTCHPSHNLLSLLSTTTDNQQEAFNKSDLTSSFSSEIDGLVQQRADARWDGNYDLADSFLEQIISHPSIPPGYEILIQDLPRTSSVSTTVDGDSIKQDGGQSTWSLEPIAEYHHQKLFGNGTDPQPTVLQLAHASLGLAVHTSSMYREKFMSLQSQSSSSSSSSTATAAVVLEYANQHLQLLVDQAHDRLDKIYSLEDDTLIRSLLRYELGGQMAADAAFWFALAGIQEVRDDNDNDTTSGRSRRQPLLDRLASITAIELHRYGFRQKRREKDIILLVERFAAAGVQSHPELEQVVSECLRQKQVQEQQTHSQNGKKSSSLQRHDTYALDGNKNQKHEGSSSLLHLHSDRSLFRLWKFSTRRKKQWTFLNSARKHWESQFESSKLSTILSERTLSDEIHSSSPTDYDWNGAFQDTSRPLVVDVGCGLGVSLLGLGTAVNTNERVHDWAHASSSSRLLLGNSSLPGESNTSWSDCNYVGVDLGLLGIRYAMGVSKRFQIDNHMHFVCCPAEDLILKLSSYPGPIRLCMIQFPTPYRLDTSKAGNSQLPSSPSDGFMVTERLLHLVYSILQPHQGRLLLQSNCEDVAVWMKNTACGERIGFVPLANDLPTRLSPFEDGYSPSTATHLPQRTIDYIESGGKRAIGPDWFSQPILHAAGRTETEAACTISNTPIHRCILMT